MRPASVPAVVALVTIAVAATTICALGSDPPAPKPAPVEQSGAVAAAYRLVTRVAGYGSRHPSAPGAVPLWAEGPISAEVPLLVRSYPDLDPGYYYVPLVTTDGREAGFVTVSAATGRWQAYGRRAAGFPSVSREEAARVAARELGGKIAPESLAAVSMPDKRVYWRCSTDDGAHELLIDVSDVGSLRTEAAHVVVPTDPMKELVAAFEPSRGTVGVAPSEGDAPRHRRAPNGRPEYDYPPAFDIEGVPHYYQITDVSCGPATLQMVMSYWGPEVDQTAIAQAANMGNNGTRIEDMMRAGHFSAISTAIQNPDLHGYEGRRLGFGAPSAYWSYPNEYEDPDFPHRHEDLKSMISNSRPVIIVTRYDPLSFSSHARVVKGYDDSTGVYVVHDPWYAGVYQGPNVCFDQELLDELWWKSRRWGGLVCPWDVTIDAPEEVTGGMPFTVTASVSYIGPGPLAGQHVADYPTITLLPSDLCSPASGESYTRTLSEWFSDTGSDYDAVSWELVADTLAQTGVLHFIAKGLVTASSTSYPSYSDSIGGRGEARLSIVHPECITVDAAGGGLFTGIQDALNYARVGDVVRILPGTYSGPRNRDLSFHGKDVRLLGDGGPQSTVLDCEGVGRGFALVEGEGCDALIEGITVRNGRAPGADPTEAGGALYISDSSPTIRNVVLESNSSPGSAGAVCCVGDASPVLERVDFLGNAADGDGGGLSCYGGATPRLERCSFYMNEAGSSGGAIAVAGGSAPEIDRCTLALNAAPHGGGLSCDGASPLLTNTIIYGSSTGAGVFCGAYAVPVLTSCCVHGNAGGDGLPDSCVSERSIFVDPLLCDPVRGALQLQECSPCAGAGVSGTDIGAFPPRCACAAEKLEHDGAYLHAVGPSPFREEATIGLSVPASGGYVSLGIYNVRGQLVRTLVDGFVHGGRVRYVWRGRDDAGASVGSGVYLVRCESRSSLETRKLVLVR